MEQQGLTEFERQLTPAGLARLHGLLLNPDLPTAALQAELPPWPAGPARGHKPGRKLLKEISARLKREKNLTTIRATAELVRGVQQDCPPSPQVSASFLDSICSLLGQQILQRASQGETSRPDNEILRLLMRREDQRLARARFMRETCRHFLNWFKNEQAREIALSRDSNAEKIEKLGKLIYGANW